jgi:hypothetical protein
MAGYSFEDEGIIEDMMQAASSRGALPLLSFAATRLWDARDRQRRLLTIAAYNQMGGVGGAFARHADQIAASVPPQSQILLRAIMTRLVTPEGTRAVVDHKELVSLSDDQREVEHILETLVRARLIHMQTDADQGATVEIVHEMLITEWPTLKRWLEDSQAMRGFVHELRTAAKQWASRGKPADLVWRGATAQEALGHAKRHVLDLSTVEKEFLAAVKSQLARSRRRKVGAVTAIAIALGLVFAGGSFALVKIKLAERQAQEKAVQAEKDRKQAEVDRAAAVAAKGELQGKLDIIAAEEKKRREAEASKQQAEEEKAKVETQLHESQQMSREQLEVANKELQRQVKEAQAAKEKAQASEALAKKATEEAKAAKRVVDGMLADKAAELARLKKASEGIATSLEKK